MRLGALEIDIVARQGALVVIVEVRTRGPRSFQGPFASISPKKRTSVLRAAERLWRERIVGMSGVERMRIDVAAVTFQGDTAQIDYDAGAIVG